MVRALRDGKAAEPKGVAFFKLGFGGEPVLYPGTYDLLPEGLRSYRRGCPATPCVGSCRAWSGGGASSTTSRVDAAHRPGRNGRRKSCDDSPRADRPFAIWRTVWRSRAP